MYLRQSNSGTFIEYCSAEAVSHSENVGDGELLGTFESEQRW